MLLTLSSGRRPSQLFSYVTGTSDIMLLSFQSRSFSSRDVTLISLTDLCRGGPKLFQSIHEALDLGLQVVVLGTQQAGVERYEPQEGLGCCVVIAAVVGKVEAAHVVH